jgi:hypothetical protein
MNWTEKSPGIWIADYGQFKITKIELSQKPSRNINVKGERLLEPIYTYVAIRPGPPDVTRFAGSNLDSIVRQINATGVLELF